MIIGHQRGNSTRENIRCHFRVSHPEGYRNARRLMEYAGNFGLPLLTFIDTPGACPGGQAEEHNQSEAIARAIMTMARLPVPVVCTVIGEGGSGGALAVGVGNRVLMLENATYSVISPEGCATILFKDAACAPRAARASRLTASELLGLRIVDEIVPEAPVRRTPTQPPLRQRSSMPGSPHQQLARQVPHAHLSAEYQFGVYSTGAVSAA
jgi:acetyl-CoA carboxylase carboxyl transferase subunit alpha